YDASYGGPTTQQIALAYQSNLKLRLGQLNQQGQQKGVDSLLILDLVTLARNRAMSDALLMTGDEDIRVGVQQAQELGVRVHLIGVTPARENQSGTLVQDADTLRELSAEEVRGFLSVTPPVAGGVLASASSGSAYAGPTLSAVARRVANELGPTELETVRHEFSSGLLPSRIDRRLLVAGSSEIGGAALTSEQKRELRAEFIRVLRES
ncbi:MAG TPA: NYN domain-containing protein, partial [Polyangiaceae bacterium]|nr:NYN domain-containing protein [Polyangiaceae bacterium]